MQVPVIQVWEDDSTQLKQSICFLAFLYPNYSLIIHKGTISDRPFQI